jgi:hypothetical protein
MRCSSCGISREGPPGNFWSHIQCSKPGSERVCISTFVSKFLQKFGEKKMSLNSAQDIEWNDKCVLLGKVIKLSGNSRSFLFFCLNIKGNHVPPPATFNLPMWYYTNQSVNEENNRLSRSNFTLDGLDLLLANKVSPGS